MALVVSILFSVALVRLLDVYAFRGRVWASDAARGRAVHRRRARGLDEAPGPRRRRDAMTVPDTHDVVILGSGPAGLTAVHLHGPGQPQARWSSRVSRPPPAISPAGS